MLAAIGRFFKKTLSVLDPTLTVCALVLSAIGMVTLIGGAEHFERFGWRNIFVQLGAIVAGFVLMVVLAHLDYRFLSQRLWPLFYGLSLLLMILLLIDGSVAGTNKSWLYLDFLPFGIQPSEVIKTALALTFAQHLSRVKERINRPAVLAGLAVHAGLIIGLILLTGDLGVALVFVGFVLLMLFCAGLSPWYLAGLGVLVAVAFPLLWGMLETYQQNRILVGFRPELDPLGYGYQPLLSRDAIMAGSWLGQGVGGGEVYQSLPASHTDFIFATVCEKLGIVGGLLVLAALLVLVVRMMRIAARSERETGAYLCVGLAACLVVQVVENIGMCFAVLPVVGITLPLVSYGGSSVLATYLMLGMAQSVNAHRNRSSGIWS